MKQTKRGSFVEACVNTAVGLGINTTANYFLLPFFGLNPSVGDSLGMAVMFTFISVGRNYLIRRFFNR